MEAGLPQCSPHGLRKIGAVRAAEASASEHELMAMFGWDGANMARLYTRKAAQKEWLQTVRRRSATARSLSRPLSHQKKKDIKNSDLKGYWRSLGESNPSFKIENLAS